MASAESVKAFFEPKIEGHDATLYAHLGIATVTDVEMAKEEFKSPSERRFVE